MRDVYPKYFTYIVECSDGTYYTGMTPDVDRRIKKHNGLLSGGARYTSKRRPVKLVFCEEYQTYRFAWLREKEIKKLTRKQKEDLIYCK